MSKIIMVDDLMAQMESFACQKDVAKFIKKYRKMPYLEMIMTNYAEELIGKKKYDTAILIYLELVENKYVDTLSDDVTVFFRLGEYYINNGDIEKSRTYLVKLCESVENYEESLEFRGLTASWQKIRHYVQNDIKPSVVFNNAEEDDDPMTDDELLNLFIEEMASGGIHAYLTNHGHKLDSTLAAAKRRNKPLTAELLELIKNKYFDGEMPKRLEAIESIIYKNDWSFEEEYDQYYYEIEKEYC